MANKYPFNYTAFETGSGYMEGKVNASSELTTLVLVLVQLCCETELAAVGDRW